MRDRGTFLKNRVREEFLNQRLEDLKKKTYLVPEDSTFWLNVAPRKRRHKAVDEVKHAPADKHDVVERDTQSPQHHTEWKQRNSLVDSREYLG